jgi:hypothetical protein
MVGATPYFLGLWWLTLLSFMFVKKLNKEYIFLFSSTLLFFLLPIASYIVRQRDFQSQSLPRYSAIVMYLFPLVLSYIDTEENKSKKIISLSAFFIIMLFVFLNTMWPMPLVEKFTLSNGTYQSKMTKYFQYAEDVVEITGSDARILIADDISNNITTNMLVPAIFLRYFMMNNSVGAQYQESTSELYNFATQNNADHILMLSYADSFEGCDQLLKVDRDYLIDIRSADISVEPGSCIFSNFKLIELGKALR